MDDSQRRASLKTKRQKKVGKKIDAAVFLGVCVFFLGVTGLGRIRCISACNVDKTFVSVYFLCCARQIDGGLGSDGRPGGELDAGLH